MAQVTPRIVTNGKIRENCLQFDMTPTFAEKRDVRTGKGSFVGHLRRQS